MEHNSDNCRNMIGHVRDALYAINGKWKLLVITSLIEGPKRFNEIERTIEGITPKVLSKELKEMELNGFIQRTELNNGGTLAVIYELTPYSASLREVAGILGEFGKNHRQHVMAKSREENTVRAED